jgi:hypothetical protein
MHSAMVASDHTSRKSRMYIAAKLYNGSISRTCSAVCGRLDCGKSAAAFSYLYGSGSPVLCAAAEARHASL